MHKLLFQYIDAIWQNYQVSPAADKRMELIQMAISQSLIIANSTPVEQPFKILAMRKLLTSILPKMCDGNYQELYNQLQTLLTTARNKAFNKKGV